MALTGTAFEAHAARMCGAHVEALFYATFV
jgi:hypothetical protein